MIFGFVCVFVYCILGIFVATLEKVILGTDDENSLAITAVAWPVFGLLLLIVFIFGILGRLSKSLGNFIVKLLESNKEKL